MSDIETRLRAVEQKALIENEHWHGLSGQIKALSLIIDCISKPLCAADSRLAAVVVKNLEMVEKEARMQNQHADFLWQLGQARKFFETRMEESRKH